MYSRTDLCLLRSPRVADTEVTFSSKKLRGGRSCWSGTGERVLRAAQGTQPAGGSCLGFPASCPRTF